MKDVRETASAPSDEQLMSSVSAGPVHALAEIYDRYERPLMSFFLRHTGQPATAEDLLHEVFLRVLKYRASYDPGRRFRSWIFRIAHNVAIDAGRAMDPRPSLVGVPAGRASIHAGEEAGSTEPRDPLEGIAAEREATRVRCALDRLTDADRRLLLLAKVEEMRYADIGEILECTEGAVKVRVHRALKRLAAELGLPPDEERERPA